MPDKISKHTKYAVDLPYPEPMIEEPNIEYANLLLKDYAGTVSEFTAINLYVFVSIIASLITLLIALPLL